MRTVWYFNPVVIVTFFLLNSCQILRKSADAWRDLRDALKHAEADLKETEVTEKQFDIGEKQFDYLMEASDKLDVPEAKELLKRKLIEATKNFTMGDKSDNQSFKKLGE